MVSVLRVAAAEAGHHLIQDRASTPHAGVVVVEETIVVLQEAKYFPGVEAEAVAITRLPRN
jgi:hypothetical protein